MAIIKHPFFLSISEKKENVTKAMFYFFSSFKEKNHHFSLLQF
jgi:hypothetical protein